MEPSVHVETDGETAALYFAAKRLLNEFHKFNAETYAAHRNLSDVVSQFEDARVRTSVLE